MERIWLKSYQKGIPAEINPDQYPSLVAMLLEACREYHDRPAFYNMGTTITYATLDQQSKAFAAYLQQELKLKKGDRIALMLPNILQYPIAMLGALRAGLVVVNVNPLYKAPELIHQINDAQTATIVVLANFIEVVEKALPETPLTNIIVTHLGDLLPAPKALLIHWYLRWIKRVLPPLKTLKALSFKMALAKGAKCQFAPPTLQPEDLAFLQYTGGTTGVSKGAMLTHRNLMANILQAEAWFKMLFVKGEEIIITALPLYHIFSLTANCLLLTRYGGYNILITNPRQLSQMIKDMAKFKFTVITGVNTLFNSLLNYPDFAKLNFSHLKLSLGGGAAVQRSVAEKWFLTTGKPLLEAYGLTETSPCVTVDPANATQFTGSIGLPVSSTDVCILDDLGKPLPIGQAGELAVKGPQVMQGYWHNLRETQRVFTTDGWLLTGDIAEMDANGFLWIKERKKDMIIVSGFNVYPNEIEDVIMQIPGISEVAVIGVPDSNSGEAVKAFVVKHDPTVSSADIIKFCRENLTGYKIPKSIEFCSELPKTNVGKILRRALRENATPKTGNA